MRSVFPEIEEFCDIFHLNLIGIDDYDSPKYLFTFMNEDGSPFMDEGYLYLCGSFFDDGKLYVQWEDMLDGSYSGFLPIDWFIDKTYNDLISQGWTYDEVDGWE